ncbi:hypothetical protein RhiLY_06408 [Ceratobasidium sp. AG-Ba]|nr:hypothetical protein RhiLY_06408 [Ceratobasidium sp. AG-Ba]
MPRADLSQDGVLDGRGPTYGSVDTRGNAAIPSDESNDITPLQAFYARNKGLLIIFLSQMLLSIMFVGLKLMTVLDKPLPTFELVAIRMGITWICCRAYMFSTGISSPNLGPKGVRKWLIIRSVVGFFGVFGLYYSIQHMPLSDATVLTFLAPTMTSLIGFMFLRQPLSWKQALAGRT